MRLPYTFDLVHDIKDDLQLNREARYLSEKLSSILEICLDHSVGLDSTSEEFLNTLVKAIELYKTEGVNRD
jgi:hypothetical protein